MKRAKQAKRLKPRDRLAVSALLAKGAAHQRRDKRASRARQKSALRRELLDK